VHNLGLRGRERYQQRAAELDCLLDAELPRQGQRLPCAGYACDNLDPTASFSSSTGAYCSAGGTTVTSIGADGGTLEMRWGGNCQVNWARFTPASSGTTYYIWAGRQSPGFNAWGYEFTGTAGVQYFSDQVYALAPRMCASRNGLAAAGATRTAPTGTESRVCAGCHGVRRSQARRSMPRHPGSAARHPVIKKVA
jgi:hypothetical protein